MESWPGRCGGAAAAAAGRTHCAAPAAIWPPPPAFQPPAILGAARSSQQPSSLAITAKIHSLTQALACACAPPASARASARLMIRSSCHAAARSAIRSAIALTNWRSLLCRVGPYPALIRAWCPCPLPQLEAARQAAAASLASEPPKEWVDRFNGQPRKGCDILVQVRFVLWPCLSVSLAIIEAHVAAMPRRPRWPSVVPGLQKTVAVAALFCVLRCWEFMFGSHLSCLNKRAQRQPIGRGACAAGNGCAAGAEPVQCHK